MPLNYMLLILFWLLLTIYWLTCGGLISVGRLGVYIPVILFTLLGILVLPALHLALH